MKVKASSFHPPYLPRGAFPFHKEEQGSTDVAVRVQETDDILECDLEELIELLTRS